MLLFKSQPLAQSGLRALVLGTRGPRFKSEMADHTLTIFILGVDELVQ
jgi:hypothetical protein